MNDGWSNARESSSPASVTNVRFLLIGAALTLFVSALPDAMVVPVLRELMVERYGVSDGWAHAFMSVNVLGAFAAVWILGRLRDKVGAVSLVSIAALANGLLLAAMALPVGFVPTLALRCAEGAVDLVVYAVLFNVIAHTGEPQRRGRRMGAAAMCMMLGIAGGLGVGGFLGAGDAIRVLWAGSIACFVVAGVGPLLVRGRSFSRTEPVQPEHQQGLTPADRTPRWPPLVMMGLDRALGGLLASTVSLMLTGALALSARQSGSIIGVAMIVMALGAWPAGRLAERVGALKLRVLSGVAYAGGLILLPATASAGAPQSMCLMALIGAGGAGLFASSLLLVARSGRGPEAMAAYHAAGNVGFLIGPCAAGFFIDLATGQGLSAFAAFQIALGVLGAVHLIANLMCVFGARVPSVNHRRIDARSSSDSVAAGPA